MKKYYKILFLTIVLGVSVIVIYNLRNELLSIKLVNPVYLMVSVFFTIIFLVINGLMTKKMVSCFGVNLSVNEAVGLSITNTLGNLITPFRGGMVSNAVYLKNQYGFNIKSYVAMLSATYVIVFWVNSLIGLIACLYIKLISNIFSWPVFLVFTIGTVFLGLVILFSPKIKELRIPVFGKVIYVINKWNTISGNKSLIISVIFLNLLNTVLIVLISYFEFLAIGNSVFWEKLVFMSVFSIFSLFLSITPANLGIKEAFAIYSGLIVGISVSGVIAVSLIDRFLNIVIVLILGLPYSYWLLRKKGTRNFSEHD